MQALVNRSSSFADAKVRADADAARDAVRATPEWQRLRRLIHTRAIGFTDRVAFDFRMLLSDAECADVAGRLMWRMIRPFAPDVLVGPGFGAAPLLFGIANAALQEGARLDVLMVRDRRKGHNMKKWVEGRRRPAGSRAVLVDDYMQDGSALPLIEKALAADRHELEIAAFALFFDMWEPLGSRQISISRLPVASLFRRHDIGLSRDCFDAAPPAMRGSAPPLVDKPLWWRFRLNDKAGYPLKSSPVIAQGAVFAADDHCSVWAHDLEDGTLRWKYESLADASKGIVQLLQHVDDSLVFGSYDGTITRLHAQSGEVIWRVRQDTSIHATPAVDLENARLFVNTEQWNSGSPLGALAALDWRSGRMLWRQPHAYWAPGSPAYCARENLVAATCNDCSLLAVDADSGALRWKFETHGLARGRPLVAEGRVYVATESGRLHCVDAASGEERWTIRYGKGRMHLFLLEDAGALYLFDGKWHMSAFDKETGELRWISRLRSPGSWCPVRCGRHLVALSTGGELAIFDPARELKLWEGKIGGTYNQPPAIAGGMLAAASNDQGLKVFRINPYYLQ